MESGVLSIDHRDAHCGFQIRMKAGGETVERKWECRVSEQPTGRGAGFYADLFWEGDVLVFQCGSDAGEEAWSMVWRYELLDSGRRLRALEQMRNPGGDFDNTWVFSK